MPKQHTWLLANAVRNTIANSGKTSCNSTPNDCNAAFTIVIFHSSVWSVDEHCKKQCHGHKTTVKKRWQSSCCNDDTYPDSQNARPNLNT